MRLSRCCSGLEPGDKLVIYSDGFTEARMPRRLLRYRGVCACACAKMRLAMPPDCTRAAQAVDRFTEGGTVRDDITASA